MMYDIIEKCLTLNAVFFPQYVTLSIFKTKTFRKMVVILQCIS